jgi:hypothetical protein
LLNLPCDQVAPGLRRVFSKSAEFLGIDHKKPQ